MEAWLQGIFADTPVLTVPWSIDYFSVIAGVLTGALFACDRKLDIIGTVVCGLITGYGGGVLRDILAGDMPYILRKHIYASASIAGGILYLLLQQVWQGAGAILTSVVVVIVIRCAAAHFEWNLPRAKTVWKSDE